MFPLQEQFYGISDVIDNWHVSEIETEYFDAQNATTEERASREKLAALRFTICRRVLQQERLHVE